nr:MAG TPA: hypothetical protein [Bacteriophage sp.]
MDVVVASLYRIAVYLYKQSVQKAPCRQDLLYVQLRYPTIVLQLEILLDILHLDCSTSN